MRSHVRRRHNTARTPPAPISSLAAATYPLAPPLPSSPAPLISNLPPPPPPPPLDPGSSTPAPLQSRHHHRRKTPPQPPSALTDGAAFEALSLCRHNRYDDLVQMMDVSDATSGDWAGITDEHGNTLLLIAAQNGLKRVCKMLLRRGAADIRRVNKQGKGVLHFCQLYGHAQLAEYLRGKGAEE